MKLDSNVKWQDFAVLGRTRAQLQPVRSLLEHYEIPFEWVCGSGSSIPLHNLREVQEGISLIEGYKTHSNKEAFTSFKKIDNLFCDYRKSLNSWKNLFLQVLDDWSRDIGSNEFPVENLINFLYDAFFQMKADQRRGDGIFVGTAHSAKGLEFKHVFVLDGDWSKKNMNLEEDRRLFYVTMTRAMENLFLFKAKNSVNPFVDNIKNNQGLYSRNSSGPLTTDRQILERRYELIGLPDLYLGLGSWHEQVRKNLSDVNVSDRVVFESDNDKIWVTTTEGKRIARLSRKAASKWQDRISEIQFASITAIVKRSKTEDDEQFAKNTKFDDWEVPIIDVVI
jgi:ATP-dependent DNA helicase RecQ